MHGQNRFKIQPPLFRAFKSRLFRPYFAAQQICQLPCHL
jgi:hypothetical protein